MDFNQEYKEFVSHITDKSKSGLMGPVKISKEEGALVRLFVAYLNCRYPSDASQQSVEDGKANKQCEHYYVNMKVCAKCGEYKQK